MRRRAWACPWRRGRWAWLTVLLGDIACAGHTELPASSPHSPHSRHPQVVWPSPVPEADSSSDVLVLAAPRSRRAARDLVGRFFDAVRRESVGDLGLLLTDGATISSGPGSSPEPVPKVWAARFKRLDYGLEGSRAPYREDELGVFSSEELAQLRDTRRYELVPAPGELLAVVTPRDQLSATGPRHFGRRMEFILGSTPAGWRILRMFEDFRLP